MQKHREFVQIVSVGVPSLYQHTKLYIPSTINSFYSKRNQVVQSSPELNMAKQPHLYSQESSFQRKLFQVNSTWHLYLCLHQRPPSAFFQKPRAEMATFYAN